MPSVVFAKINFLCTNDEKLNDFIKFSYNLHSGQENSVGGRCPEISFLLSIMQEFDKDVPWGKNTSLLEDI